jgi:glycosyltransferase involved in cell wall biosynthesis
MPPASVSVILIVKDGEAFIAEALESVLQSSAQPLETLVIDGGSRDRTREVAAGFPHATIIAQRTQGLTQAYNEGIERARGELIAFISHDDRWLPGKLDRQLEAMSERPELEFTVTLVRHFLEPGASAPHGFRQELLDAPVPGFIMETLLARRGCFDVVGMLDPAYRSGSDTDWFARATDLKVPHLLIPEVLVEKRVHDGNASLLNRESNLQLLALLRSSVRRKRTLS